jgi:GTPase Era involved in 16S rRNA processing
MDQVGQPEIEQALQRMICVVDHPRALAMTPDDRGTLRQAIQRAHAQLLGEADAVLTIALAGCTGAGKSTLINALAGSPIADASDHRPCTTQTRVYHHRQVACGGLPPDLARQSTFVVHDRPELRQKVLVDTPDLDTFYTEHRAATQALLKAAGLVIYVFSPERYVEERAWSVIRQEQRFSACLAVINKADTIATDVLQRIAAEIRQRFADMGKPEIPVLCIAAARHVPAADVLRPAGVTLDEFLTLRAYIEQELQAGDIARMIRQQRLRMLDHLEEQVNRAIPADAASKLDSLCLAAAQRARTAGEELAADLQSSLLAIELDLYPLIVMRKHQRFWGPFRTWLSVMDFLRYGLPGLVRKWRLPPLPSRQDEVCRFLPQEKADLVGDRLQRQAQQLQTFCFENGLPVERWRQISGGIDGRQLLALVSHAIEERFETLAAAAYRRGQVLPWTISFIAWLLPAGLVVFAIYHFIGQFIDGHSGGLNVLWDSVTMLVLSYLLLHMLAGAVRPGRGLLPRKGVATGTLEEVLQRTLDAWVKQYCADVETDIADLREPLSLLRRAATGTILRAVTLPAALQVPGQGADQAAVVPPALEDVRPIPPAAATPPAEDHPATKPASLAELLRNAMQPSKSAGKAHREKPGA